VVFNDTKTVLNCSLYPGYWTGNCWQKASDSDNETYLIEIFYYNQNYVTIFFEAHYGLSKKCIRGWKLVERIAKKWYFFNESVKKRGRSFFFKGSWEEIQKAREEISPSNDIRDPHSWSKTVTLTDAIRIFDELKLEVNWPVPIDSKVFISESDVNVSNFIFFECTGLNEIKDTYYKKYFLMFEYLENQEGKKLILVDIVSQNDLDHLIHSKGIKKLSPLPKPLQYGLNPEKAYDYLRLSDSLPKRAIVYYSI
jgi:hypothetical protein